MIPFKEATNWAKTGDGTWQGTVTPDWTQGRTIFGGCLIAGAIRSMDSLVGTDRRVRMLSAALMDAVGVGKFETSGTVLRQGRSVSVGEIQVRQGDTHAATILTTYGVERTSKVRVEAPPHEPRPAPEAIDPMPYPPGPLPPCPPPLERHFTHGQLPFTSGIQTELGGWIRLRDPGHHPQAAAIAMLDAFPFPFMQTMEAPAPITTISLTSHFLDLDDVDLGGHWWLHSKTIHAANGYSTFDTRLYRPDARLGAWSEQLVGIYDKVD